MTKVIWPEAGFHHYLVQRKSRDQCSPHSQWEFLHSSCFDVGSKCLPLPSLLFCQRSQVWSPRGGPNLELKLTTACQTDAKPLCRWIFVWAEKHSGDGDWSSVPGNPSFLRLGRTKGHCTRQKSCCQGEFHYIWHKAAKNFGPQNGPPKSPPEASCPRVLKKRTYKREGKQMSTLNETVRPCMAARASRAPNADFGQFWHSSVWSILEYFNWIFFLYTVFCSCLHFIF